MKRLSGDRVGTEPRLSVVTVCLDAAADLSSTLESVAAQDLQELESVVVDGGSSDGSWDVVRKHRSIIGRAVSEPDGGIYDAMNKGLDLARGDHAVFLNAGDLFHDAGAARAAVLALERTGADVLVGDTLFIAGERKRRRSGRRFGHLDECIRSWNHQAVFMRRVCFDAIGRFDTSLRVFADQDLLLRARVAGLPFHHLPRVVVDFRYGDTDYDKHMEEKLQVVRRHGTRLDAVLVKATAALARGARRLGVYRF